MSLSTTPSPAQLPRVLEEVIKGEGVRSTPGLLLLLLIMMMHSISEQVVTKLRTLGLLAFKLMHKGSVIV